MKNNFTIGYVLRLSVTLFLITGVVAALLAGVNAIAAPRIEAAKQAKLEKAISSVLSDGAEAKPVEFTDETGMVKKVYASPSGYAMEVHSAGFGGYISMMVGVSKEGKVTGVSIISHSETPGLGAVAAGKNDKGKNFRNSFIGLFGSVAVSKDGGQADTITSATITSRAVAAGVNAALACAENFAGQEEG